MKSLVKKFTPEAAQKLLFVIYAYAYCMTRSEGPVGEFLRDFSQFMFP